VDFFELAKQFVCSVIAAALSVTAHTVERLLRHRPDWLEKVHLLADRFRAIAARRDEDGAGMAAAVSPSGEGMAETPPTFAPAEIEHLLDAYQRLAGFVHDLKVRGLNMDDAFFERVEREWSVSTLCAYIRSTQSALQEEADKVHHASAAVIDQPDG
jgi:hypothetical protein